MAAADLELQGAIVARLRSYPPLTALVGQKIYDNPPADAKTPYVTMGDFDVHRDDVTCSRGFKIFVTLHAWSVYGGGFLEVRQIADAIVDALHEHPMNLPTNQLISLDYRQTRTMRDPDGMTSHGVIEFVAYIQKA